MFEFLLYIRGRMRRNRQRTDPMFPPLLWNTNGATLYDLPRTSNAVDGWHHRFNTIVGKCHANLYEFIAAMRKEQAFTERIRAQHAAGRQVVVPNRKYANLSTRIRNIVADYANRRRLDFLRAIALNLNY